MLKDRDKIVDTKSAMVLEDLIGQFLYGNKEDKKTEGEANDAAESH